MATKKKMLQAAAGSATGGAGLDITDVFSTYLYEGNGGTQVIENGINLGAGLTGTSVELDGTDDVLNIAASSDFQLNGDFTIEGYVFFNPSAQVQLYPAVLVVGREFGNGANIAINLGHTANPNKYAIYVNDVLTLTGTIAPSPWHHFAVTRSGNTWRLFVNGVLDTSATRSGSVFSVDQPVNIGSESPTRGITDYTGNVSNIRVVNGTALYTSAFSAPTGDLTAVTNTVLLTCQGLSPFTDNSTNGFTVTQYGNPQGVNLGPVSFEDGEGGLVWTKVRTQADNHYFWDTERGVNKRLSTNQPYGENNETNALNSFNSNGFTLGSAVNVNGSAADWGSAADYASWTFRKAPKFFDVVTYTGTGDTTTQTISHNLGAVPGCIIVKRTDSSDSWRVYHRGVDVNGDGQPWTDMLTLNTTAAASDFPVWGDTAPTSTEFTVGYESSVNGSGGTYVAYLFAHNDGDGEFGPDGDADIIKCGSYTGNGSTDGPEIDLGFEPQFVILKRSSASEDWLMFDNMRGMVVGGIDPDLRPAKSQEEGSFLNYLEPDATGFKLIDPNNRSNASGSTYIYIAIRRGSLAAPESATEVFDVDAKTNLNTFVTTPWPTDLAIQKDRQQANQWVVIDRMRGGSNILDTSSNTAENTNGTGSYFSGMDYMDGIDLNFFSSDASNNVVYNWKRAPGFFDVVAYTGDGVSGRTISHNLGVPPELSIFKRRSSSASWLIRCSSGPNPNDDYYTFSSDVPGSISGSWLTPTDTTFGLGFAFSETNASGATYISYHFASLDGISKVGRYTGTGSGVNQDIDCGFTSGARFVLLRRANNTGDWVVFDTERGIVVGNDGRLKLNSINAETFSDQVDPYSGGFSVTAFFNNLNDEYIFYAIA